MMAGILVGARYTMTVRVSYTFLPLSCTDPLAVAGLARRSEHRRKMRTLIGHSFYSPGIHPSTHVPIRPHLRTHRITYDAFTPILVTVHFPSGNGTGRTPSFSVSFASPFSDDNPSESDRREPYIHPLFLMSSNVRFINVDALLSSTQS
jgi:hypothetical protein